MRRARIYRSDLGAGTGVSSRVDTILIFGENEERPADLVLTERHFREQNRSNLTGGTRPGETTYWAAVPCLARPGLVGPMDDGNLAVAHYDGKPERIYHVHDRWETPEQYAALST
jgi:hypothetical protein